MNINENLCQFKKGVSDTCNLFRTLFKKDRNIILSKDGINYINNINQLLDLKTNNSNAYSFAINYTLIQIQNFRENICINPILYIEAFEQLFHSIINLQELEKYNFAKIVKCLEWYYDNSKLSKAKVNKLDIQRLFYKERQDKFLSKIIDLVCNKGNVEIVESKTNSIVKHKYYKLKARYLIGQIYGENYKIFITNILTKDLFIKLVNTRLPILVLCNSTDFEVNNSYNLSIFNITQTEIIQNYLYICMLTGFGKGYQNLDNEELNNHSFGSIKEFKFVDGILQFSGDVYFTEKEVEQFNHKETLDKYYTLQGKNLLIECTEEYLEKVKTIVSTIKSLQNSGIFYTEPKTLRIIYRLLENEPELQNYIHDLLIDYLELFEFDYKTIMEVVDNSNLSASFNVNTGKYDNEIFTSLDYYLNIFTLLDSNVKTLSKLY